MNPMRSLKSLFSRDFESLRSGDMKKVFRDSSCRYTNLKRNSHEESIIEHRIHTKFMERIKSGGIRFEPHPVAEKLPPEKSAYPKE